MFLLFNSFASAGSLEDQPGLRLDLFASIPSLFSLLHPFLCIWARKNFFHGNGFCIICLQGSHHVDIPLYPCTMSRNLATLANLRLLQFVYIVQEIATPIVYMTQSCIQGHSIQDPKHSPYFVSFFPYVKISFRGTQYLMTRAQSHRHLHSSQRRRITSTLRSATNICIS